MPKTSIDDNCLGLIMYTYCVPDWCTAKSSTQPKYIQHSGSKGTDEN